MMAPAAGPATVNTAVQLQPFVQPTAKTTKPVAPEATAAAGQHEAADAAMYREMRMAVCGFDAAGSPKDFPPRHRAFFTALRSVLGQVLEEKTEASRHMRLLAAHQWYVKHKPRQRPADMDLAAAMAASLSVQNPVQDAVRAGTAAHTTAAGPGCGVGAHKEQKQQQLLQAPGALQELLSSSCEAASAERQEDVCRAYTSRWLEQQTLHLHELECGVGTAAPLGSNSSRAGVLHTQQGASTQSAHPATHPVTACLPEQPSLRAVPAIQAVSSSGSAAVAAAKLRNGNRQGSGTPPTAPSCSKSGTASRPQTYSRVALAAAPLPPTDGLIPVGSFPSGRFLSCSGCSNNDGSHHGLCSSYEYGFVQWRTVADQQQQVQDAVAAHMRSYARHRARLEEEINRKQEMAMQLAAAHRKLKHTAHSSVSAGSTAATAVGALSSKPPAVRALLHVDSQHQPSQVETTYSGLDAGPGWAQRLAPVDKVKEAKQLLLQDSQRECAEVTEQIMKLGFAADVHIIQRALLPLPDVPYMTCMAHLPKPGRYSSTGAMKKMAKKNKKLKRKKANKAAGTAK